MGIFNWWKRRRDAKAQSQQTKYTSFKDVKATYTYSDNLRQPAVQTVYVQSPQGLQPVVHDDSSDFLTSMLIAESTGSTFDGALIGGNLAGAIVGAQLSESHHEQAYETAIQPVYDTPSYDPPVSTDSSWSSDSSSPSSDWSSSSSDSSWSDSSSSSSDSSSW